MISNQVFSTDFFVCAKPEEGPQETVSSFSWYPNTNIRAFACTSWDSKIRFFRLDQTTLILGTAITTSDPCLGINWQADGTRAYAACIDGSVLAIDIEKGAT